MPRYFRLEDAEKLLPQVEQSLRQAIHLRHEHQLLEQKLQEIAHRLHMMGGMLLDRQEVLGQRVRRDALAMRLKEIIEEIHALGVQIKDLEIGLIDFPTLYQGNEVLLCWKLGETGIAYWHGTEEGYRGRKEIDADFREHHTSEESS